MQSCTAATEAETAAAALIWMDSPNIDGLLFVPPHIAELGHHLRVPSARPTWMYSHDGSRRRKKAFQRGFQEKERLLAEKRTEGPCHPAMRPHMQLGLVGWQKGTETKGLVDE